MSPDQQLLAFTLITIGIALFAFLPIVLNKPDLPAWAVEAKYGDWDTAMQMLREHNIAQDKADGMRCPCHTEHDS